MKQLVCLQRKENEAVHNYFIRAQELSTRLEHVGEHISEPLLNAMVLNSMSECYKHFVVHESFNLSGSFVEIRTRLMNYEENRFHWEYEDDVDSHVTMTSKTSKTQHKSTGKNNALSKSSTGQLTCYCCGTKGHKKAECYKRETAECTFY